MPSFFDQPFSEQLKVAINNNDPKFLQVLLGSKYCQLGQYWLIHSILSYNVLAITKAAECQLPIDIITSQRSVLEGKFAYVDVEMGDNIGCTVPIDKIAEVNKALEENSDKTFSRYENCANLIYSPEAQMVSIPLFYDTSRVANYALYGNLDEYSEREKDIGKLVEKFKNDLAFIRVFQLNFISQYKDICQLVNREHKFKVTKTDKIADLIDGLRDKYQLIQNNDERVELVLDQIRKNIINKIRDENFVNEMYGKLLDNVLNAAEQDTNHPLYQDIRNLGIEDVKNRIKTNSSNCGTSLLNNVVVYAAEKTIPDLNIIGVLLINGSSLTSSVYSSRIQRRQAIDQYFLESSNSDVSHFPEKSIYTIMREVHKLLFDFPIMEEGMNLSEVLSSSPSKFAQFNEDVKSKIFLTKVGEEGEQKLMKLLDDYKKLIADKEAGKDPRNILVKLWSSIASMFVTPVNETRKGYATVYKKLNECVEVGNLAIATGDDKVIIDFAKEIKKEQKNEQDTYIKDLYQIFLVILYEHQDLIKCPWWKWEALSYKGKRLLQWNPAWENLLTTPELKNKEYDTRASQWSDANFKKTDNRINNETLAQSNALVQAQGIIEEKDQIIEQRRLKEEERQSKGRNRKRKGQQSLKKH